MQHNIDTKVEKCGLKLDMNGVRNCVAVVTRAFVLCSHPTGLFNLICENDVLSFIWINNNKCIRDYE